MTIINKEEKLLNELERINNEKALLKSELEENEEKIRALRVLFSFENNDNHKDLEKFKNENNFLSEKLKNLKNKESEIYTKINNYGR